MEIWWESNRKGSIWRERERERDGQWVEQRDRVSMCWVVRMHTVTVTAGLNPRPGWIPVQLNSRQKARPNGTWPNAHVSIRRSITQQTQTTTQPNRNPTNLQNNNDQKKWPESIVTENILTTLVLPGLDWKPQAFTLTIKYDRVTSWCLLQRSEALICPAQRISNTLYTGCWFSCFIIKTHILRHEESTHNGGCCFVSRGDV
jgi:hypothetical protein